MNEKRNETTEDEDYHHYNIFLFIKKLCKNYTQFLERTQLDNLPGQNIYIL